MSILVTGSVAFDTIMDFPDSFRNHILPDQLHILNVAFTVGSLEKNYGGCAPNIAHTIKMLGGDPVVLAPIGKDGKAYLEDLEKRGIKTTYMKMSKDIYTASAHITTDKDDNQIIAFYKGALDETADLSVNDVSEELELAIIGPTQREGMIRHSKECFEKNIPTVFDPGQMITMLSPQDLQLLIGQATYLIANDYEMKLIEEKTGWLGKELLEHVEVVIMTLGEKGSVIMTKEGTHEIGSCSPKSVEDPTGAGDAYRGGFFTARAKGHDWKTCGQVGATAATFAIEHYGTQNHSYTMEAFVHRYQGAFNEPLAL